MTADNIPCVFFPGKLCPVNCPNHQITREQILEVASECHTTEEAIISQLKIDPRMKPFAQGLKVSQPDSFAKCVNNPVQ